MVPRWLYCVHWQTQPLWLQVSGRETSPCFPAQTLSLLKSAFSSQLTHCHLGQVTTVSKPTHHCTESVRQSFKYLFWFVIGWPQSFGPAAMQECHRGGQGGTKLLPLWQPGGEGGRGEQVLSPTLLIQFPLPGPTS